MQNFTIYQGDCLEMIDQLPTVKAVITDPPYTINVKKLPASPEAYCPNCVLFLIFILPPKKRRKSFLR